MTTVIVILKWIFSILLCVVVYRLYPCAKRSFTKDAHEVDPLWALICGFALNRLWFVWRNSFAAIRPPREAWDEASLVIGYVFAIALAVGTLAVHKWRNSPTKP